MGLLNFKRRKKESGSLIYKNYSRSSDYISEVLKGLIDIKKVKFPAELGEAHPFDFDKIDKLVLKFGLLDAIVNKFIDYMLSGGINIQSEDERATQIIKNFMRDYNFDILMRDWFKEAFIKGNGFLELGDGEGGAIEGTKILDARYMYVNRDEYGKIIDYRQFTRPLKDLKSISKEDIEPFKERQIAHLPINRKGSSAYGYGLIYPLLYLIDNLLCSNKEMHTIMRRKANSPLFIMMGNKEKEDYPTPEEITDMGQSLEVMTNKHDWALSAYNQPMTVDFGNIGDKFQYIVDHDLESLFMAAQIPSVIMGKANVPEGLAKVNMRGFEHKINSLRENAEKVIEEKIFKRVLNANGLDVHVEVIWGLPSEEEKMDRAKILIEALKNPFLNEGLKKGFEIELGGIFEIPEEEIEEAEEERKEEEEKEKQPIVPEQRQKAHHHVCNVDKGNCNIGFSEEAVEQTRNLTLKEWIGFNYDNVKNKIIEMTRKDRFELLRGITSEQLKAGLLSSSEIEKLRLTMEEGFDNNYTIRQIEKELNKRITFKDRYRLKDGRLVVKDGKPILSLRSKYRANMIARTETVRLSNLGAVENYKENDVKKIRWISAVSERTCSQCIDMNGKILPVNSGMLPPVHSDCRCTVTPVVE